MEKNKLVVGNMKMVMNAKDINDFVNAFDKKKYDKNVVLCPSSLYLPYFIGKSYGVGIQNIAMYEEGAYTGEVSAKQVSSMKIDYTIIGHSERRDYFKETDEVVRKKILLALQSKLKVILCIGESESEREELKTYKVLKRQITSALKGLDKNEVKNIIIAYEPIWAIGTGKVPTKQEIIDTVEFIKSIVSDLYGKSCRVLYGGSVNDQNIASLNKIDILDGYLVGGASCKVSKFEKIIEVVMR